LDCRGKTLRSLAIIVWTLPSFKRLRNEPE
jgi:hypothetical protein